VTQSWWRIDLPVLLALAILIAVARLHTYHQPVDWDVATYAIMGHELNLGQRLYTDIWNTKPPATYISYMVFERVFGYGLGQVYALGVFTAWATMLGIYFAILPAGQRWAALAAAAAFAIVSGDMGLDANRANSESFINSCLAWAIALLVHLGPRTWCKAAGVGLLVALATLYKQVALIPAMLALAAYVALPPSGIARRSALVLAAIIVSVIGIVWLATLAYFAATDRGELFWLTSVAYPRFYGGSLVGNVVDSLRPRQLFPRFLFPLLPCAAATVLALFLAPTRLKALLIALIVGTQVAIALPKQFFEHYYQYWLATLALGTGWGLAALPAKTTELRWLSWLAASVVLACLLIVQIPSYFIPATKWAEANYGAYHAWTQPVADELAAMLGPDETFFVWADEAWLYFKTKRRPPTPGFWRLHFTEGGPIAPWLTERSLEILQRSPPRIIVAWGFNEPDDHPIDKWVWANYEPIEDGRRPERFPLLLLKRKSQSTSARTHPLDLPARVAG
jgi:hypothetical protein